MDIVGFLGRFHPLIVHLPIGMLLLAVLIAFLSKRNKYQFLEPVLNFILLLGAVSAAAACILGFMLAKTGDYDPDTLFWHQWGGILLTVVSFGVYLGRVRTLRSPRFLLKYSPLVFLLILILVFFTGHQGGNLTHGSEYLLHHAPNPVRVLAGLDPRPDPRPPVTHIDSADIFLDVIQPLVAAKCQSCHNPNKTKGELVLSSYEEMLRGGKSGPAIVPGDPEDSEFYRRVTLPEEHDDFMPAEGKPGLTTDELALVRWWIEQGAPDSRLLAHLDVDSRTAESVGRILGLSLSHSRLPARDVDPADSAALKAARAQGFIIESIAPESNFLEVRLPFTGEAIGEDAFQALLPLSEQIAWMDLSGGRLGDQDLELIGQLPSLSRLDLSRTPITDAGLSALSKLDELSYLNLYGTSVSDDGLKALKNLKKLRSIYLWQTQVSGNGVEAFRSERPDIMVERGYL